MIIPDGHIESIFNYCTRRCERCAFTSRCTLFQSECEYERQRPDATWKERLHDSFAETFRLVEEWCRREGVDFDEIRRAAENDETDTELERASQALNADPLQKLATAYVHAAFSLVDAMTPARAMRQWSPDVEEALDTISWNAGMIGAKVHRALHGLAERDAFVEEDPVQNDWNGSAKLARILVSESKSAWQTVLREGEAPEHSPLLEVVGLLDRIDAGISARFPDAMQFVRPGFDDGAVAAELASEQVRK
jgi:hypothetical protein